MATDHLDSEAVVAAYASGEGASALARQHGVSVWAILKRVRDAGVRVRTVKEQCEKHRGPSTTTAFTFGEIIDGIQLGDAYIARKGFLHLSQSDARLGWLLHLQEMLLAVGAESKLIPTAPRVRVIDGREVRQGPGHVLYTPCYTEIQEELKRWCPQGKKIVPRDLRLTPVSVAHWFCGDGSCDGDGHLQFHTNGFVEQDTAFLVERLLIDLGITTRMAPHSRPGQFTIGVIRLDEAVKLRDIIAPLMPECCLYKLRFVHAARTDKVWFNQNLTNEQVLEIRRRFKPGLGASLAREFDVRPPSIHAIAQGRTYKHLLPDDPLDIVPDVTAQESV